MTALELLQGGRRPKLTAERPINWLAPVASSAAIAIIAVGLLSMLAAPSNGHDRLKVAGSGISAMEASLQHQNPALPYPAGAVCPSRDVGVKLIQQRLQQAAANAGVPLTDVSIGKASSNEASGLTEFTITFGAQAQYDALLRFLDSLSKSQPQVFVDTADLTPNTSVATLKLTGRAVCWTVARQ